MTSSNGPWAVRVGIATAALFTMLVAGCAGGSSSTSAGHPDQPGRAGQAQSQSGPDSAREGAPGLVPPAAVRAASGAADQAAALATIAVANDRKLARAAQLTIRVTAIERSSADVRKIAADLHGYVAAEQIGGDGIGSDDAATSSPSDQTLGGRAALTLSVPATVLDQALDRLAHVGTVTQRSTSSTDVTKEYVDTSSRMRTMTASVDRLRALMQDTKDVKQIIALESALTTREATLESLTSQLSALKSEVAMSTVTVRLSTTATPAKAEAAAPSGFAAGLGAGWHALVLAVTALLTVLGMVLPFLVPVLLVGVPLVIWLRRQRQRGTAPSVSPDVG